jgi:hypothetical protein
MAYRPPDLRARQRVRRYQPRSARALRVVLPDVLFVVSVDEDMPLLEPDDVSVEPAVEPVVEPVVPLAPMLDVPVLFVVSVLVLLDELGEDDVVPLAPMLFVDLEPAFCAVVPVELALLLVLEALVPPEPALEPLDCARATPPTASAAAAARVVRVVFNMSCSLNGLNPRRGNRG